MSEPNATSSLDRRKRARDVAIDVTALLILFAIVCGPFLRRVYASTIPGGWDGVPHYAIADVYARKLFPSIGGWIDEYFGGMPYPNFYPPIFYVIVAALAKLGLGTKIAFWTVQTVASAAVPLLTYLCARRLTALAAPATERVDGAPARDDGRVAGLVSGAITVGLMVDYGPLYRLGITLHSTFDAGLSTQLLSHVFLLLFYFALLAAEESRFSAALAAIAFALVPLTNIHMVWAAAFLFLPLAAARVLGAPTKQARRRTLLVHGAIGLAGVLVAACWTIPMIANLRYVPTQALERPPTKLVFLSFLRLGTYLVFGAVAAFGRRDRRALALVVGLVTLVVFALLPSTHIPVMRDLALQPARVIIPFPFLAAMFVGYLVGAARELWKNPWAQPAIGLACAALFFYHFKLGELPKGNISQEQMARYENVLAAVEGRTDGRVLVEQGPDGLADPFALQALVGMRGARSLTTVFRESALDVMFAVPLRNSFSAFPEAFGIDHKITGVELAASDISVKLARLRLFNVRYFAVRSDAIKAQMRQMKGLSRISPEGAWELWGFDTEPSGYAVVPEKAPVLTFAKFSVKPRPGDSVDFVRLGEEMFEAGRLRVPLALARDGRLDRSDDWDRFEVALVTDYRYDDLERAFAAVERFSRDRSVVLWPSDDPLYARLAELAKTRSSLTLVTPPDVPSTSDLSRRFVGRLACKKIFEALEAVSVPVSNAPVVTSAELDGRQARIALSSEPDRPVPIWIRQGYFPSWKNDSGEPVYMATPTFQLTFTRARSTSLHFRLGALDWIARALTLAGLGLAGALAFGFPRRGAADASSSVADDVEPLAREAS